MAGDWIKMRTQLAYERAVMLICDRTGLDEFQVVGRLHAIWAWAGEHTITGDVRGVTLQTVDRITRCTGFAEAMKAADWLDELPDGTIRFPRWKKHNSKSAKQRALAAERQARKRAKKSRPKRDAERDTDVTSPTQRQEETRGEQEESPIAKSNGTATGSSKSQLPVPLPKDARGKQGRKFNKVALPDLDWDHVAALAEKVAKRIPPDSDDTRRHWFKYAAMSMTMFSENWLMDSVEGVLKAASTETTRQGHFVGILKSKAAEQNIDEEIFASNRDAIEVPDWLWKSNILEVK